jgi:DNA-3-methyladenine glycosylase II
MSPGEIRAYLIEKDARLTPLISKSLDCPFFYRPTISQARLLSCLTEIVIGQQLSNDVAQKIWKTFRRNAKTRIALEEKILGLENVAGKREGLSGQKIKYLQGIVLALRTGILQMSELQAMTDSEATHQLCRLKGLGTWSAEMFLMFGLHRLDIFSLSDYGLVQATKKLYGAPQLSEKRRMKIANKWRPYRSVVSWHLWIAHDG